MTTTHICNECETVSHCMKNGCVPKVAAKDDAMRLALEALESCGWNDGYAGENQYFHDDLVDEAITALREALAEKPAQRKPLTPEWIWIWLMDWCKRNGTSPANYDSLFRMVSDARAIEAAHGIKENT